MPNANQKKIIKSVSISVGVAVLLTVVIVLITPREILKNCDVSSNAVAASSPAEVSVVLAPTNNFVDFETTVTQAETAVQSDLGYSLPDENLGDAIGRKLGIVVADGSPKLVVSRSIKTANDSTSAFDRRRAITSTYGLLKTISSCAAGPFKVEGDSVPTQPETDLLAALSVAADQLDSATPIKKIYVLGNGIQTAGAIKMQETGQFPKTPKYAQKLAFSLRDIGALPDLHGANVVWYGLGQVDGVKQKLGQKAQDSLVSFWQQVVSLSNGILVSDDIKPGGTGLPAPQALQVSPVGVIECSLVVKLYEADGIKFQPDSAQFVDQSLANTSAKKVVTEFKAAGCDEMTVRGFAAAGMDQAQYKASKAKVDTVNKALTAKRAQAFAKLLSAAGFAGDINTVGAGTCGTEWSASGKADPVLQGLCRRVEVTN